MSAPASPAQATDPTDPGQVPALRRAPLSRKLLMALVLLALLVLACAASLAIGVREVSLPTVWDALWHPVAGNNDISVVREQRVPRTLVGALAGAALAVSGALLQGLTRNPIADPGLLGVNAGSSLAVIVAITVFGLGDLDAFVWFAYAGAAIAAALVYGVASTGWEGATPVRLALVGAAATAMMTSLITLVLLTSREALEQYRFWSVGSLNARGVGTVLLVLAPLVVGMVAALSATRFLNATALGDDLARGLGQNIAVGRTLVIVGAVLLAGSATALAGPVAFVGLMVPHAVRALIGPDYRWVVPLSALGGPVLLLLADVVGRVLVRPSELEAGIVVAVLGAPALIALVRRSKAVSM
ncbi:iron ABC transporter permease [Marmoricola endophyticus]|uniref:Iron ABC transporter permease n=1 Tax=Marmoricola endophyticus TaxID=2040280 RepID=A0A917BBN3_9ACTN|nr:iron ABC transporter permease [Marmoricola endophyticus]GGF32832.1 iron ABC transporter permease [Marmoricola endophyticus]